MTHFSVASIGSYPRTGEEKDHQRYPRALGHFERKEISAHALRDVEQSVAQEVIREQIDNGADEVTDGLIAWPDPISRFCRHLTNVRTAGLARYFDNNFYYRTPVFTGKPKLAAPAVQDYAYAKQASNKPVRAVLTGPLTLARCSRSEEKSLDKFSARFALFADVIEKEFAALAGQKAPVIQIDEPALADATPDERKLLAAAFPKMTAARDLARVVIATYFRPVTPAIDFLASLPVDGLQLDLTSDGAAALEKLATLKSNKALGLGVVDARRLRVEPVEELTALLRPFLEKAAPETVWLTPSCGLEFLPRPVAAAKFRRLAELKGALMANGATGA